MNNLTLNTDPHTYVKELVNKFAVSFPYLRFTSGFYDLADSFVILIEGISNIADDPQLDKMVNYENETFDKTFPLYDFYITEDSDMFRPVDDDSIYTVAGKHYHNSAIHSPVMVV